MTNNYAYISFYLKGQKVGAGYVKVLSNQSDRRVLSDKQGIEHYDEVAFKYLPVELTQEMVDIINDNLSSRSAEVRFKEISLPFKIEAGMVETQNLINKNMKHNKILFLDVDGVINIPPYDNFNDDCLDRLKDIITKTKCKVVISSSWRTGDIQLTKEHFPKWLQEEIIGETVRGYHFMKQGSSFPNCRGIEIKHWLDRNLVYPWHASPEMDSMYRVNNPDGSFKIMNHNTLNKDFTYVILDDDQDMLYDQRRNFILTDPRVGISPETVSMAIYTLNAI